MSTTTREHTRTEAGKPSDEAWRAYMTQRGVEDDAEAAYAHEIAQGIQNGPAEAAWEAAESEAARLFSAYQRTVDHIRA